MNTNQSEGPKKVTVEIGEFQRIVDRFMTPDEALRRARKMNLSDEVTRYVVEQFYHAEDLIDSVETELFAGKDGRLELFEESFRVAEELAGLMGVPEGMRGEAILNLDDHPEVAWVFDAFFEG